MPITWCDDVKRVWVGCSGWNYPHWREMVFHKASPPAAGSSTTPPSSTRRRVATPSTPCRQARMWRTWWSRPRPAFCLLSRRAASGVFCCSVSRSGGAAGLGIAPDNRPIGSSPSVTAPRDKRRLARRSKARIVLNDRYGSK